MKITMEERLRKWGFHEEDIPGMLKELEKLPSIEREEEVLIAEAAFQALMKVKIPNYNYQQGFRGKAEMLCSGDNLVEATYDWTIPRLMRKISIWEIKDIITNEMTEENWATVIEISREFIKRCLHQNDNRKDSEPIYVQTIRNYCSGMICIYLDELKRMSEEAFKRVMEDEFIRAEVFKEHYIVEHLDSKGI